MIYHLGIHHGVEAVAKQVTSIRWPANTQDFRVSYVTICERERDTEDWMYHPTMRFGTALLLLTQNLQELKLLRSLWFIRPL